MQQQNSSHFLRCTAGPPPGVPTEPPVSLGRAQRPGCCRVVVACSGSFVRTVSSLAAGLSYYSQTP